MDVAKLLSSGLDPSLLAFIGNGDQNSSDFTSMLMRSLNPNPAGSLAGAIGQPDLGPIEGLIGSAPNIKTASATPSLPPAQSLQATGFGMAAAAGKPGSTALSSLGEGGMRKLEMGEKMSERAIREAAQENQAALAAWEGKGRLASKVLDTQMKVPELDAKQMDLAGNMLQREDAAADRRAYQAGLLADKSRGRDLQSDKNEIDRKKADILAGRADAYGNLVDARIKNFDEVNKLRKSQMATAAASTAARIESNLKVAGIKADGDMQRSILENVTRRVNQLVSNGEPITPERLDLIEAQVMNLASGRRAPEAAAAPGAPAAPGTPGAPETPSAPAGGVDEAAALAEAEAAIAKGADVAKVNQRLLQLGINKQFSTKAK